MKTRTVFVVGLVVALLIGGVASYYASSHPDGLEHVADKVGIIDTAEKRDALLSGGLAGLLGAVIVMILASGLAFVVRRRGGSSGEGGS